MTQNQELNQNMEEDRKKSRFIKSYKYKHKLLRLQSATNIEKIQPTSCDASKSTSNFNVQCVKRKSTTIRWSKRKLDIRARKQRYPSLTIGSYGLQRWRSSYSAYNHSSSPPLWLTLMVILVSLPIRLPTSDAFCPFKCLCDDQSLSANCTQVPSITIIPMTFNPLLKQLTLNHLPMTELSNSLSVYRRLEYLNLNSNLLRQIKYQNFNFKPAPPSVLLSSSSSISSSQHHNSHHQSSISPEGIDKLPSGHTITFDESAKLGQFELTNSNNEQLARNLKQAIDKSISQSATAIINSEDEIRFHLRDMDLGDNRIDQLGSLEEFDDEELSSILGRQQQQPEGSPVANFRLKSQELERLAPFLTLTRLENLNLSGNRLTKLHQHVFLGLVNLKRLDLSRNQLEFIDRLAFVGLIELELLKLDHNRLASHLQPLGLAFCRAPMMELRFLDLSNNYKSPNHQELDVLLPNQMFICAPRLVSLRLDGLQLRYIQVNAFDNLQQLESLNLSQNYLEQVPSDSLSYSNSNLSLSLRQLDLSDTLIEFVNARSFGALRNLQRLCLNSMARLVSFDLSSLSIRYLLANDEAMSLEVANKSLLWQQQQEQQQQQQHGVSSNTINHSTTYANLVPATLGLAADEKTKIKTINHRNEVQLINDQLIELQLKHNPRLQSLHSSLAVRSEPPRGRIRFTKLRLLDLHNAVELRDFGLDELMDLGWHGNDNLRVDLSQVAKLNCSSCQMSWLVEAAKQQLYEHRLAINSANNEWPPALPYDPSNVRPKSVPQEEKKKKKTKITLLSGSIGCVWPFAMPLVQLIELETSYAPIFGQDCQRELAAGTHNDHHQEQQQQEPSEESIDQRRLSNVNGRLNHELSLSEPPNLAPGQTSSSPGTSLSSLALATLLALVVIFVGAKLALTLLFRRRHEFKWRSPSLAASSIESPSSSNNPSHSPADCSSSSILSSAAMANGLYGHKQQQHQHQQTCQQLGRQQQRQQQQYERARLAPTGPEKQRQQLLEQLNNQLIIDGFSRNNVASMDGCRGGGGSSGATVVGGGLSGPIQIEWAHRRRGNLFSRIAERLSATSWRPSSLDLVAGTRLGPPDRSTKLLAPAARVPLTTSSAGSSCPLQKHFPGTCIIENLVYGGDGKILANNGNNNNNNNNNNPANKTPIQSMVFVTGAPAAGPAALGSRPVADSALHQAFSSNHLRMPTGGQAGPMRRHEADFIKPAYCQPTFLERPEKSDGATRRKQLTTDELGPSGITTSLDFVYANCQQQQLQENEEASSSLIMEPTSYRRQMIAKQLQAIEMDPRNSMLACDSPQHQQLQHQSQWILSTSAITCPSNSQHQQPGVSMEQRKQPRYLSGAGSSGPAAPAPNEGHSVTNSQVQPIYLDSVGNNSLQLGPLRTLSQIPKSATAMGSAVEAAAAAATRQDSPLLVDSGHIYVTLDGPIKQQNGCDEYGRYERPQQQQQQQLEQLERQKMQPSQLALEPLGDRFPVGGNTPTTGERGGGGGSNCPVEDYKSFEWSLPFSRTVGVEQRSRLGNSKSAGPLEGRDKFKLGHEAGESEVDCRREQQQQLVGQSGGKLSSSLQKIEGNIRQHSPITLANNKPLSNGAPLPDLPFEASAAEQQELQFASGSSGVNSGGQMSDNKNGNNNSDFAGAVKSRKSKNKSSRFAEESAREKEKTFAVGQATGQHGNVTGHTDYHDDDDDDDDDDVGNGFAQRALDGHGNADQLNGRNRQKRQLFMDLNSLVETTTTTTSNESRGLKRGLATTNSATEADGTNLNGSLEQAHPGACSKYDANHGPTTTTTTKAAHNNQNRKETADQTDSCIEDGHSGRPPAPSDNSDYNWVINGLQSKQHGGYVEQNYGVGGGQMGVFLRPKANQNNNNSSSNSNNISSSTTNNNATNLYSSMMDDESSILIGQRHSPARGSSSNCHPSVDRSQANGGGGGGGGIARGDASDYLYGQQKFCDIPRETSKASLGGGAMIRGLLKPLGSGSSSASDSSDASSTNSASTRPVVNNGNCVSNNEIYSNQFYYCRPSAATLARVARSNETSGKLNRLRQVERDNGGGGGGGGDLETNHR